MSSEVVLGIGCKALAATLVLVAAVIAATVTATSAQERAVRVEGRMQWIAAQTAMPQLYAGGTVAQVGPLPSARERAVDRAKLVDFHFHDLRHTFVSWAVQRGASLQEVNDLLGHHSLAMTLRYGHLAPEHLRSAVARLDATLPASDSAQASAEETRVEEALVSK